MTKIQAPFTKDQIKKIKAWQKKDDLHPMTCGSPEGITECQVKNGTSEGILKVSQECLTCPCAKYTQNWVHGFMII